jgi:hypothetical protein
MANPTMPSYSQSGPPSQGIVQKEYSLHLYIHQIYNGSNANQTGLANSLLANNWTIRDGASPSANIVGRVQGMHCVAGPDWFFCDNMLFTDKW